MERLLHWIKRILFGLNSCDLNYYGDEIHAELLYWYPQLSSKERNILTGAIVGTTVGKYNLAFKDVEKCKCVINVFEEYLILYKKDKNVTFLTMLNQKQ